MKETQKINLPTLKQSRELTDELIKVIYEKCDKYDWDKIIMTTAIGEILMKSAILTYIKIGNEDGAKTFYQRFNKEIEDIFQNEKS